MSTQKTIAMFAVLCLIALGLGYWVGQLREGSGRKEIGDTEGKEKVKSEVTPKEPDFLKNGLVAYYPFNGNAKDESGNGHDGENSGATLTSDRREMPDNAYAFREAAISLPNETMKGGAEISVTVWINVGSGAKGVYPRIVGGSAGSSIANVWLGLNGQNHKQLHIEVDTPNENEIWGQAVIENGIWFHVALVFDGSELSEYINGTKKTAKVVSGSYPPMGNIYIGGTGRYLFHGTIDDVRIYNRALSEAEVKELYDFEKAK